GLVVRILVLHERVYPSHEVSIQTWQFIAFAGQGERSLLNYREKYRAHFLAQRNKLLNKIAILGKRESSRAHELSAFQFHFVRICDLPKMPLEIKQLHVKFAVTALLN